jgi:hypothetical protein
MYYNNPCRHYLVERTMYGEKTLGCMHPRRKELNRGWFARLLDKLFPHRFYHCEARAGYETYCPFFERAKTSTPQQEAILRVEQEIGQDAQRSYTE